MGKGKGYQDSVFLTFYMTHGCIEKLDANFNSQWSRVLCEGSNSSPFRVYEKENGDIHFFGAWKDSTVWVPNSRIDGYWLSLDGATGNTLRL